MADNAATFEINLGDGVTGPAETAGRALAALRKEMDADRTSLSGMQRAMRELKGATTPNVALMKSLQTAIDSKKQSLADASVNFVKLGGSFNKFKPPTSAFRQLQEAASQVPGPLANVIASFGKLKELVANNAWKIGAFGIAAAMVAITVAAVGATAALLKYGIAQANARRSELLRLEGMTKMRNWWGLPAGNAKEMQNAIDQVSASTTVGRDKIAGYSNQLYKAGLRGQQLTYALEGAAIKASAQGDEAASAFMGWAAGANMAGQSVKKLSDDVKARLGRIVTAQMLDLNVQVEKLHESFAVLFSGLNIEGFLRAMYGVTSLFSQSTRSGQALKEIVGVMLKPLISVLEYLGPLVRRFFQGMIIAALRLAIVFVQVRLWFREAFGDTKLLDLTTLALWAGVAAVGALGLAFVGTFGMIVAALVFAAPFLWGAVAAVGALAVEGLILAFPFILAAVAIGALIAAGYQLGKLWLEIDWSSLGTALIDGLVGALKNGAAMVKEAVIGLADMASDAFKDTLGISSPSKVFTKYGVAVAQGAELGIKEGSGGAQDAAASMVTTPAARGGAAAGAGAGGGASITIGELHVHAKSDKPDELAGSVRDELERILSGVALQMGAATGGA